MNKSGVTERRITELAHEMMQVDGYSNLRFAEIAKTLNITRAAIHNYFPNKVDLARRVIANYRELTEQRLTAINQSETRADVKLRAYVGLYRAIIEAGDERLCPGGMLAAEAMNLPLELRAEVQSFFDLHVSWVAQVLFPDDNESALMNSSSLRLVAFLQGALLVSRLYGNIDCFDSIVQGLLEPSENACQKH